MKKVEGLKKLYTLYMGNPLNLIPTVRETFDQLAYEDAMRG